MCDKKVFLLETGASIVIVKADSLEQAKEKMIEKIAGYHAPWHKESATEYAKNCVEDLKEITFEAITIVLDYDTAYVTVS